MKESGGLKVQENIQKKDKGVGQVVGEEQKEESSECGGRRNSGDRGETDD